MVHSLTLNIPDSVFRPLADQAAAKGQTVEDVVIEKLSNSGPNETNRLDKWVGALQSGIPDAAANHDTYIGENLFRELKGDGQ